MHVQDNWYFEARENGDVRIAKTGGVCVHELIVTKAVWESIKKEVEAKPITKGRGAKMKAAPPKSIAPQSKASVATTSVLAK